jgi:hypothetical protein
MRIAILGWGSLICDPRDLRIASNWNAAGLLLPIEFSRISDSGRLTLVIDEMDGEHVPTRCALSGLDDLDAAVANLQEREGTRHRDRVGFVDLRRGKVSERACETHPAACERIRAWAEENKLDGVVWTALESRFEEKAGEPFSVDAVIRYLTRLSGETRDLAFEYIRKAPAEVMTPVRRRFAAEWDLVEAS